MKHNFSPPIDRELDGYMHRPPAYTNIAHHTPCIIGGSADHPNQATYSTFSLSAYTPDIPPQNSMHSRLAFSSFLLLYPIRMNPWLSEHHLCLLLRFDRCRALLRPLLMLLERIHRLSFNNKRITERIDNHARGILSFRNHRVKIVKR